MVAYLFWALDVCIVNAYDLYKHSTPHPLSHLQFREKLVDELLEKAKQKNKKRPRSEANTQEKTHYWASLGTVGECNMCSSRNKNGTHRKQTRKGCAACNVHYCCFPCYQNAH